MWRDHTRVVGSVADVGGRLELFEAKWTELPSVADTFNLAFVRDAVGKFELCKRRTLRRILGCSVLWNRSDATIRGRSRFRPEAVMPA